MTWGAAGGGAVSVTNTRCPASGGALRGTYTPVGSSHSLISLQHGVAGAVTSQIGGGFSQERSVRGRPWDSALPGTEALIYC